MKNAHETHECTMCFTEFETQEHVYTGCKEILKVNGTKIENYPKYEKIFNGNRKQTRLSSGLGSCDN